MHNHTNPEVHLTPHTNGQGMDAKVVMPDECTITFRSPSVSRWNGGWPVVSASPPEAQWHPAEIDAARRAAFPEHR